MIGIRCGAKNQSLRFKMFVYYLKKPFLNDTVYNYKRVVRSLLSCAEFIARANIFTPSVDYDLTWFKLLLIIDADERHHLTPQTGKLLFSFIDSYFYLELFSIYALILFISVFLHQYLNSFCIMIINW